MPKIQIVNNCQGPHYLQLSNATRDGLKPATLLILQPGLNMVDADALKQARKINKGIDNLFKWKVPFSMAPEAQVNSRNFGQPMLVERGKPMEDTVTVAALPFAEAEEMVNLTEDTDQLVKWQSECSPDKNGGLLKAIDARLRVLAAQIKAG